MSVVLKSRTGIRVLTPLAPGPLAPGGAICPEANCRMFPVFVLFLFRVNQRQHFRPTPVGLAFFPGAGVGTTGWSTTLCKSRCSVLTGRVSGKASRCGASELSVTVETYDNCGQKGTECVVSKTERLLLWHGATVWDWGQQIQCVQTSVLEKEGSRT